MEIHNTANILVQDGERVLLIKRANEPNRGWWALPGGHVDEGETVAHAAQREAQEEVGGVTVEKEPFFVFVHHVPAGEKRFPEPHQHRCHSFKGKVTGEIRADSDAEIVQWVLVGELKNYKITDSSVITLIKALGEVLGS